MKVPVDEIPEEFYLIAAALDLWDPDATLEEKRAAWDRLYGQQKPPPMPRP